MLLRMNYVGFCGSDINTFMGRNTMALNPVIPGHEIGAVIEAVGPDVPESVCNVQAVPQGDKVLLTLPSTRYIPKEVSP